MEKEKRPKNKNQLAQTPKKPTSWMDKEPTKAQQKNMDRAVIRYMIATGKTAKELDTSSRQCQAILPYLCPLSPEWNNVGQKHFKRDIHVQHEALYLSVLQAWKKPPTQQAIEREKLDLNALAAKEGLTLQEPTVSEKSVEKGSAGAEASSDGTGSKAPSWQEKMKDVQQPSERKERSQILGKRPLSTIFKDREDIAWDEEASGRKGMKLWWAWQDAKEAEEASECAWFAHMTKHYNAKQAKLDTEE